MPPSSFGITLPQKRTYNGSCTWAVFELVANVVVLVVPHSRPRMSPFILHKCTDFGILESLQNRGEAEMLQIFSAFAKSSWESEKHHFSGLNSFSMVTLELVRGQEGAIGKKIL